MRTLLDRTGRYIVPSLLSDSGRLVRIFSVYPAPLFVMEHDTVLSPMESPRSITSIKLWKGFFAQYLEAGSFSIWGTVAIAR